MNNQNPSYVAKRNASLVAAIGLSFIVLILYAFDINGFPSPKLAAISDTFSAYSTPLQERLWRQKLGVLEQDKVFFLADEELNTLLRLHILVEESSANLKQPKGNNIHCTITILRENSDLEATNFQDRREIHN